jgi:hypothetical protein
MPVEVFLDTLRNNVWDGVKYLITEVDLIADRDKLFKHIKELKILDDNGINNLDIQLNRYIEEHHVY